jgi:hypothetical protein
LNKEWTREKIKMLVHKKGPKYWKDRMAIEYYKITGLHASTNIMNLTETDSQYKVNLLLDYKHYLFEKALNST